MKNTLYPHFPWHYAWDLPQGALSLFCRDTKTIDSLKIAFPHTRIPTPSPLLPSRWKIYEGNTSRQGLRRGERGHDSGYKLPAVGQALSAGSADIGFISCGNYVLFSDDCDVLLTALRYGINKDSDDPKDWNDGTIEEKYK